MEHAEYHLSAFNTIVEVMAQLAENPAGILNLFPNYFLEVVDESVARGLFSTREEAFNNAAAALAGLFAINQRIAFMFATEVAEEIGGNPPNEELMIDPIERRRDDKPMTQEEVMNELKRIMSNNNNGGIQ
jgi:hypothetical protein